MSNTIRISTPHLITLLEQNGFEIRNGLLDVLVVDLITEQSRSVSRNYIISKLHEDDLIFKLYNEKIIPSKLNSYVTSIDEEKEQERQDMIEKLIFYKSFTHCIKTLPRVYDVVYTYILEHCKVDEISNLRIEK
jgi:hypothetical protein